MTRIAFLDSGIGGLSVLKTALTALPHAEYLYFADCDNAPYGTKSRDEVHQFILNAVDFLSQFELDALVIACNTATSVSGEVLRKCYNFPIIGMEPAVKPASLNKGKRIAVTATSLTLSERKLQNLISQLNIEDRIDKIDLDKLVLFGENLDFSSEKVATYLQTQLAQVRPETHDAIVLGCTHFVFYKDLIQKTIGNVEVIDGNLGTVNHLMHCLPSPSSSDFLSKPPCLRFFNSGVEAMGERLQVLLELLA